MGYQYLCHSSVKIGINMLESQYSKQHCYPSGFPFITCLYALKPHCNKRNLSKNLGIVLFFFPVTRFTDYLVLTIPCTFRFCAIAVCLQRQACSSRSCALWDFKFVFSLVQIIVYVIFLMICFKSHHGVKEVLRRDCFFLSKLTHIFHNFVLFSLITFNSQIIDMHFQGFGLCLGLLFISANAEFMDDGVETEDFSDNSEEIDINEVELSSEVSILRCQLFIDMPHSHD